MKNARRTLLFVSASICLLGFDFHAASAHDDGQHHREHANSTATQSGSSGQPGSARNATRTVAVAMSDAMRFDPGSLVFKRGETVRLRITNTGKLPHEFVLGTAQEIAEHAQMMNSTPGMVHAEANAVRVAPGCTADLLWKFSVPGQFSYACLIPGHREAGMRGVITVTDQPKGQATRSRDARGHAFVSAVILQSASADRPR